MPVAAVSDVGVSGVRRSRIGHILLAVFAAAGVVDILKGLAPSIREESEFYWLITYGHGFVRRALVGTLVHPVLQARSFAQVAPFIVAAHVALSLCLVCMWQILFRR